MSLHNEKKTLQLMGVWFSHTGSLW